MEQTPNAPSIRPIPYGWPRSRESYMQAREASTVYGNRAIIKSLAAETTSAAGKSRGIYWLNVAFGAR
jgi:hypothetical protein